MIKDYNSTAYFSLEKFRSSERSLKMPEKPGMPTSASLPTRGKLQPPRGTTAMGYCGVRLFVCLFLRKHTLNLLWRS